MNGQNEVNGVLVIYTGGTIGSVPKSNELNSPLVPLTKSDVDKKNSPLFSLIPRYDPEEEKIDFGNNSVRVQLRPMEEPIDSSNVSPAVWGEILDIIKAEYNNYEGFVILHGTDTMTYTSSILAFMIDKLNKPIIVTGSQKPIGETRNDAVQNLVTAIEIAAAKTLGGIVVPEVCIFFRNTLLRGCRSIKYSATDYEAFISPNFPELGTAGEHLVINEKLIRSGSSQNPDYSKAYSPKVTFLRVAPGMDTGLVSAILSADEIDGIILLTYGTGNAPTIPDFLDAVDASIKKGKIIVNITQCMSGEVQLGLYDVSAGLLSRGVISGLDMTSEAAYTKLCHLLDVHKNNKEAVADWMQINMRGEQRQSIFNIYFGEGEIGDQEEARTFSQKGEMIGKSRYRYDRVDKAFLRIMGITEPDGGSRAIATGKVYLNMESAGLESPKSGDNYLGSFNKRWHADEGSENIFLTITDQVKRNISGEGNITITVVNESGRKLKWEKMQIGIFADT